MWCCPTAMWWATSTMTALVETHLASGADITVAYQAGAGPLAMTDNLLLYMDPDGRVN